MSKQLLTKTDLRTRYTKQILKKNLLALLEKKSLNKITVQELCENASINRTTFYVHFTDIYALFDEMKRELEKSVLDHMEKWIFDTSCDKRESLTEYLRLVRENAFLYLMMRKEDGTNSLKAHTWEVVKKYQLSDLVISTPQLSEKQREFLLTYRTYGITFVIDEWLNQDTPISAHELADIIYQYCIHDL